MADNHWTTPTLKQFRISNQQYISGELGVPLLPNDVPGVLADANAGNAHLNLQYLDYLSGQILPSTATGEFLDKWASIYLINSDRSRGRKLASFAGGSATITASVAGTLLPAGTQLYALNGADQIIFETIEAYAVSTSPTTINLRSLTSGSAGNLATGSGLTLTSAIPGISASSATVVALAGGADAESDDRVRDRVLNRIANPPMGGDANDWQAWCLAVPGVTRAWVAPNEVCAGTVTIRIMCDDLRAYQRGLPTSDDIQAVRDYIEMIRPITVAQYWVKAPELVPVNFRLSYLNKDTVATRAAVASSVSAMITQRARPSSSVNGVLVPPQTIYAGWVSDAIYSSAGVRSFTLKMDDFVPARNSYLPVLGSIAYD